MAYDEELAARIRDHLLGEPGLTERKMFGGLGFMLDGHMAVAASSQGRILLRVPPERTEELLARPHAEPMVMNGRELTGWLDVGPPEADLEKWVDIGVTYVRTLPPK